MDTIVIAVGMPFCLAFLDQPIDEVVTLWESWVESGELVRARHEDPTRDAVIRLRPAVLGVAEFIANEPAGRLFVDRMLWSLPSLISLPGAADYAPQSSHYWTLQMNGFAAKTRSRRRRVDRPSFVQMGLRPAVATRTSATLRWVVHLQLSQGLAPPLAGRLVACGPGHPPTAG